MEARYRDQTLTKIVIQPKKIIKQNTTTVFEQEIHILVSILYIYIYNDCRVCETPLRERKGDEEGKSKQSFKNVLNK